MKYDERTGVEIPINDEDRRYLESQYIDDGGGLNLLLAVIITELVGFGLIILFG